MDPASPHLWLTIELRPKDENYPRPADWVEFKRSLLRNTKLRACEEKGSIVCRFLLTTEAIPPGFIASNVQDVLGNNDLPLSCLRGLALEVPNLGKYRFGERHGKTLRGPVESVGSDSLSIEKRGEALALALRLGHLVDLKVNHVAYAFDVAARNFLREAAIYGAACEDVTPDRLKFHAVFESIEHDFYKACAETLFPPWKHAHADAIENVRRFL